MTAPKPQQITSKNERLKTSKVRRAIPSTDREQFQFDARIAQTNSIAGMYGNAIDDPFAVHERAIPRMIDETDAIGFA